MEKETCLKLYNDHYENLLIWGYCWHCMRKLSVPESKPRAEDLIIHEDNNSKDDE